MRALLPLTAIALIISFTPASAMCGGTGSKLKRRLAKAG